MAGPLAGRSPALPSCVCVHACMCVHTCVCVGGEGAISVFQGFDSLCSEVIFLENDVRTKVREHTLLFFPTPSFLESSHPPEPEPQAPESLEPPGFILPPSPS